MSAAVEAGIEGIPAMAFPFRLRMECRFETMKPFIRKDHPRGFRKSFTPRSRIKRQFPKINKGQHQRNQNMSSSKARWIENLINDKHHKEEITIGLPESL
jgi:hypothetical protein